MLRISWAASRAEILRLDESEWEAVVAESQPTVGLPKGVLLKQLSNLTGFQIRILHGPHQMLDGKLVAFPANSPQPPTV